MRLVVDTNVLVSALLSATSSPARLVLLWRAGRFDLLTSAEQLDELVRVTRYPKTRPPYSPEFRRQIVDLVRSGRDPSDLAREFEPSAQAIRNWVGQADRQEGRAAPKPAGVVPAMTADEREELTRLRRENKQLRVERDILSRAAAGTHRTRATGPGPGSRARMPRSGIPRREGEQRSPGAVPSGSSGS